MSVITHDSPRPSLASRIRDSLTDLIRAQEVRYQIHRERRLLATLDDRILKDIGITRADADFEASRAYTDVPEERQPQFN